MKRNFIIACVVNLTAVYLTAICTAQANPHTETGGKSLTVKNVIPAIQQQACASRTSKEAELTLSITPIDLGEISDVKKALPPQTSFLGGWHLTNADMRFGGFSGLATIDDHTLLAISDKGYFLKLETENSAPKASATLFPMLTKTGQSFEGKRRSDAEGLAYKDGIAYVSFEHQHRIDAFDIARCGLQATALTVSSLPNKINKTSIKPNNGAEALHINMNGEFVAGYETVIKNHSPRVTLRAENNEILKNDPVKTRFGFKLVGESESAILFRAYNPIIGNRTIIQFKESDLSISLTPPLKIDNFEGITEQRTETGERIIYIISDNNFSDKQRTLLYAFKISP